MERSDQNPVNESELDIEDLENVSGGRFKLTANFHIFTITYDSNGYGSSSASHSGHADHARA